MPATKKREFYSVLAMLFINFSLIINWRLIASKPFWYSEEASQRYHFKPLEILINGQYAFNDQTSDGSVFNLLSIGIFTKLIPTDNQFIELFKNQILLSSLLLWFSFFYFGTYIRNKGLAIFGSTIFTFSFVGFSTSIFYSKSCGILLFLIVSKLLFSVTNIQRLILSSSLFSILFFGLVSNIGVLLSTLLFLYLQQFLIKKNDLKKRYSKNLQIYLLIWLPIYALSVMYLYFLHGSFSNLKVIATLNPFLETNTSNLNYLLGGGHWPQVTEFVGYRYMPWWPNSNSLNYYISVFLFLLCVFLFTKSLKTASHFQRGNIANLHESILDSKFARMYFALLFYITVATHEINILSYATNLFPIPFAVFRDPWSKFYVYLFLNAVLFFVYYIENSGLVNAIEEKQIKKPKRRKSKSSRRLWRILSVFSLISIFFFQILNLVFWNLERNNDELPFYSMNMKNTQTLHNEISNSSQLIKLSPDGYVCIISKAEDIRNFIHKEMQIAMGYDGHSYKNIDRRIVLCSDQNMVNTLNCSPPRHDSLVFFLPRNCYVLSQKE